MPLITKREDWKLEDFKKYIVEEFTDAFQRQTTWKKIFVNQQGMLSIVPNNTGDYLKENSQRVVLRIPRNIYNASRPSR